MRPWIRNTTFAFAAGALALAVTAPQADAQWRHRSGRVAAGVAAGVIGGAIVGSALAARPYGYYGPAYGYYDEPYGYTTYSFGPSYDYGPTYYVGPRYYGYVPRGSTGLRAGVTRVSPTYDY